MLETIFLYVIIHNGGNSNNEKFRTEMPTMAICQDAIKTSRIALPSHVGNDFEATTIIFCGTGKFNRHYGETKKD